MASVTADAGTLDVAIIGAGLCGLQLAALLQPAGQRLAVFEARARIGGRTLTVAGGAIDLGPTWFWPRTQPRMTQLVAELGLRSIRQHDDGRALYHDQADQPPRTVAAADLHGGAQRLDGGMARLAAALAERLPAGTLRLQHRLRALVRQGDHIELQMQHGAEAVALRARQVVLALPPRLVDEAIRFTPQLPAPLRAALRETPTWMASAAKAAMQYPAAFWREAGHSGNAFIRHPQAVLCETFDACNPDGGTAALAGFFDLDPEQRQLLSPHLPRLLRGQFAQLFGSAAAEGSLYHYDWAAEPLTCSALDRAEVVTSHPLYGDARLTAPQWDGRLLIGGSETAAGSGGYLEGALAAAARIAGQIVPRSHSWAGASDSPPAETAQAGADRCKEKSMARTLMARLNRDRIPDREALQQAIVALGRPLALDAGAAPFATAGYLPCTVQGEDAGFDLRVGEAVATGDGREVLLTFTWSGDAREEAAACIVCAALAAGFDGHVQAGDAAPSTQALLATADACLESF